MDAYIYDADLLCEECANTIKRFIPPHLQDHEDSDRWPQGPYPDGGGEADSPQHCGICGVFLENPLTSDGYEYVRELADIDDTPLEWGEHYGL